jgi:hypothetical protein
MCAKIMEDPEMFQKYFMDRLIGLMHDKVLNVKIAICKALLITIRKIGKK